MAEKTRIGLMGGTFDPIHLGHLVTAETARIEFDLDQVIFIPAGNPPHKTKRDVSAYVHRLLMTILATGDNDCFDVSRVEENCKGPSYTYDTVRYFRDLWGEDVELYFITGADAILELLSWNRIEELLKLCYFIAATRPGFDLEKLDRSKLPCPDRVIPFAVPALAISSTDIRARVSDGRSIKYLVPETVRVYIRKNGLYQQS